jgi:hypothetical protein
MIFEKIRVFIPNLLTCPFCHPMESFTNHPWVFAASAIY